MIDAARVRQDFPILSRQVQGKPLIYLDNAATTQKPRQVIDALSRYYSHYNANIHRGIHTLAEEATAAYEGVREQTAKFIGAASEREIVFTRNATESINLFAYAWARRHLKHGDEILLTEMEHHANLVPWQLAAQATGAALKFIPITPDGQLVLDALKTLLTSRTKVVAFTHMSNVLGTINPVAEIAKQAKARGAIVLVDAAQSAPHLPLDVQALGADVVVFSAHKMLGPTGVGVLWAPQALLEAMPPFLGGGEMISDVQLTTSTWNEVPWKFEAGTPNISGVIAFGEAMAYLQRLGMAEVSAYEQKLTRYAIAELQKLEGLTIYGPTKPGIERGSAVSFNLEGLHPHDVGTVLDAEGVAVRAGHHCAQPLMRKLNVPATVRASLYIYNTPSEVDRLIAALKTARAFFQAPGTSVEKSHA